MNHKLEALKKELEADRSLRTCPIYAAKVRAAIAGDVRRMAERAMMTDAAIAKQFDLAGSTIERVRDENGIANGGDMKKAHEEATIISLWNKYLDPVKVGDEFGMGIDGIKERLKKLHHAGKINIEVKVSRPSPQNRDGKVVAYFALPEHSRERTERGNAATRKTMQQRASDSASAGWFKRYWDKKFSKYDPETRKCIESFREARL